MRIGGIGFIPSSIKWVIDYIIEFCEGILKDSIEIYGAQDSGYEIEFKLDSTGMIIHIDTGGRYFIIYATLLECTTPEKEYLLKKEFLEAGFKETITRMKVLMLDQLDSILKVKKK